MSGSREKSANIYFVDDPGDDDDDIDDEEIGYGGTKDNSRKGRIRTITFVVICLVLILVVAAAIAGPLGLGLHKKDNKRSDENASTPVPSLSPVLPPTSEAPTERNPTSEPSMEPTLMPSVSMAPTQTALLVLESILGTDYREFLNPDVFLDESTPQYKALDWLVHQDTYNYNQQQDQGKTVPSSRSAGRFGEKQTADQRLILKQAGDGAPTLSVGTNPPFTPDPESQKGTLGPTTGVNSQTFGETFTPISTPSGPTTEPPANPAPTATGSQQQQQQDEVLLERYVFAMLYFALDGPIWRYQSNFLSADSVCEWNTGVLDVYETTGITCDPDTGQRELRISGNYYVDAYNTGEIYHVTQPLVGSVPPELFLLSSLGKIEFHWISENFTALVPTRLDRLASIHTLLLPNHASTGTIPSEIGLLNMTMKYLSLTHQGYVGSIPSEVGSLSNLETLSLAFVSLSGTVPSEIGLLSSLRKWIVTGGDLDWMRLHPLPILGGTSYEMAVMALYGEINITGTFPSEIGAMTRLEELKLFDTLVLDTIPSELGLLTQLTMLGIKDTPGLVGGIPSELYDLTKLTSLTLSNNSLTGSISPAIGNLKNMTRLYLSDNQLSGQLPQEFAGAFNLSQLYLENNSFTGTLPPLPRAIFSLYLQRNNFEGSFDSICRVSDYLNWPYSPEVFADCGEQTMTNDVGELESFELAPVVCSCCRQCFNRQGIFVSGIPLSTNCTHGACLSCGFGRTAQSCRACPDAATDGDPGNENVTSMLLGVTDPKLLCAGACQWSDVSNSCEDRSDFA